MQYSYSGGEHTEQLHMHDVQHLQFYLAVKMGTKAKRDLNWKKYLL